MPAITNYASLKQNVLATLEREEDTQADALFASWVGLAEADFAPVLRAPWAIRMADFTWGDDPELRYEFLPPSFVEIITVLDMGAGKALEPLTPPDIARYSKQAGYTRGFVIHGYMILLVPDPGGSTPLKISYYSKQEPLTEIEPVNSIIQNAPNLYFYNTLVHGALAYGEQQNAQLWRGLAEQIVGGINDSNVGWRRGALARVRVLG